MLKIIKVLLIIFYFLTIVVLSALGSGYVLYPFANLMVLGGWVFFVLNVRLQSVHSMKTAILFFIFGALFNILGLKEFGEELMRIFFILFVIGFVQAFFEYGNRKHVKTS